MTIQAILFGILLFADFGNDFDVTPTITTIARLLEGLGAIILLVSIYDLRRSLNIAPQPVKDGQMQSHGIYKYIRHPMYTSVFLITIGVALNSGSCWKFGIVALLFVFFRIKTEYEEGLLKKKYPSYKEYMNNTGRYLPVFSKKAKN